MKLTTKSALVAITSSLLVFASCSDNEALSFTSSVDTKEMPVGQWVDDSYRPGDNYYMYRNGRYWAEGTNGYYEGLVYTELPAYVASEFRAQMERNINSDYSAMWSHFFEDDTDALLDMAHEILGYLELLEQAEDIESLAEAEAEIMRQGGCGLFTPFAYAFEQADGQSEVKQFFRPNKFTMLLAERNSIGGVYKTAGLPREESDAMASHIESVEPIVPSVATPQPRKLLSQLDRSEQAANRRPLRATRDASDASDASPRFDELVAAALGWDEHYLHTATDRNSEDIIAALEPFSDYEFVKLKNYCIYAVFGDFLRISYDRVSNTKIDLYSAVQTLNEEYSSTGDFGAVRRYADAYYGYRLVDQSEAQTRVAAMLEEGRSTFARRIDANEWLSPASKAAAQEKLAAMKFFVGGVDEWPEVDVPQFGDDYCENLRELRKCNIALTDKLPTLERRSALALCLLTCPLTSDYPLDLIEYTFDVANCIYILPSNLIPALTSASYSDAFLYGTLGPVFGNSFDPIGTTYDKDGRYGDWLTATDRAEYDRRAEALVSSFSELLVYPEEDDHLYVDGEKTLDGNIACVTSLAVAHETYMTKLDHDGFYDPAVRTQQSRRFFEAFAEYYRARYSYLDAAYDTRNSAQALDRESVNGTVRNIDAWYEAYDVQPSDALYLAPERRLDLW